MRDACFCGQTVQNWAVQSMGVEMAPRPKTCSRSTNIRIPRVMREDLRQLLQQDGRSLAEFTRGLWSNAIRTFREELRKKPAPPKAS